MSVTSNCNTLLFEVTSTVLMIASRILLQYTQVVGIQCTIKITSLQVCISNSFIQYGMLLMGLISL